MNIIYNKTNPSRILGYLMALVMVLFTNVDALAQNTATICWRVHQTD